MVDAAAEDPVNDYRTVKEVCLALVIELFVTSLFSLLVAFDCAYVMGLILFMLMRRKLGL